MRHGAGADTTSDGRWGERDVVRRPNVQGHAQWCGVKNPLAVTVSPSPVRPEQVTSV